MIKRRHDARTLHRWRFLADLRAEMMIEDWQWDDDDRPSDECLHGDGMDPDCDYLLQCPDCGGSW